MPKLIEPWRKLAVETLSRDPAVTGLLELRPGNPDTAHWDSAAAAALAGDEPMQSLLTEVAMRAGPLLADARATFNAIVTGSPIPSAAPGRPGPLGGAITEFRGGAN